MKAKKTQDDPLAGIDPNDKVGLERELEAGLAALRHMSRLAKTLELARLRVVYETRHPDAPKWGGVRRKQVPESGTRSIHPSFARWAADHDGIGLTTVYDHLELAEEIEGLSMEAQEECLKSRLSNRLNLVVRIAKLPDSKQMEMASIFTRAGRGKALREAMAELETAETTAGILPSAKKQPRPKSVVEASSPTPELEAAQEEIKANREERDHAQYVVRRIQAALGVECITECLPAISRLKDEIKKLKTQLIELKTNAKAQLGPNSIGTGPNSITPKKHRKPAQ